VGVLCQHVWVKGFKTKVFVVKPRQRLSLQSHEHRHELWTIVSGQGICTVDDKVFEVTADSFVMDSLPHHYDKSVGIAG
jgi:mannose-6-phosphate isomerase-like protein (cupin superfamily)